jgi:MFS family permease
VEYEAPPNGFRTFLIVLITQGISVLGNAMSFFAITVWLTQTLYPSLEQKPQLAMALTAVGLAFALPAILIAPIAGAWADRHDRRRTMLCMDVAAGVLTLGMACMLWAGSMSLWNLVAMLALTAVVGQFHGAALDTSYAMLVANEALPRANGMIQTMFSLSGILAPGLAATLVALPSLARQGRLPALLSVLFSRVSDGAPFVMVADSLTFFVAAGALAVVSIPSLTRADQDGGSGRTRRSMWADVKEGARYIVDRRPLLLLLGIFAASNLALGPLGTFSPMILKFKLAPDWMARGMTFETAMALLGTVRAVGGLAGGFLISTWGGLRKRRVYGVLVPLAVGGLTQAAFGLSSTLFMAAAVSALSAATFPIANAHSQSIWQHQTPREMQGRVFAVRRVIAQCTAPLSTAAAGWAAAKIDPGIALAILGAFVAALAIAQSFNPIMLRVEDKEWLDRMAAGKAALTNAGG